MGPVAAEHSLRDGRGTSAQSEVPRSGKQGSLEFTQSQGCLSIHGMVAGRESYTEPLRARGMNAQGLKYSKSWKDNWIRGKALAPTLLVPDWG